MFNKSPTVLTAKQVIFQRCVLYLKIVMINLCYCSFVIEFCTRRSVANLLGFYSYSFV